MRPVTDRPAAGDPVVGHLVVGPAQHGVVRFAEGVLAALEDPGPVVRATSVAELGPGWTDRLAGCDLVHLQYTDALYAPRCEEAADTLVRLVGRLSPPCSVTLHDLPQPGDGAALLVRRAACYRAVVRAAVGVVVSSEHESTLLDAVLREDPDLALRPRAVVPLPVEPHTPTPPERGDGQVTVLGFLHPGKGHDDALDALAALPAGVGLVALGRPAPGHEDLPARLRERAHGRAVRVTGFVEDLAPHLRSAGVPLAPHRAVSASGSVGTWLSAGRRPLVPAGRYADELLARCPGALWTYDPGGLPAALALALAEPERTWLAPGVVLGPSGVEVGQAYHRAWAGFA